MEASIRHIFGAKHPLKSALGSFLILSWKTPMWSQSQASGLAVLAIALSDFLPLRNGMQSNKPSLDLKP